MVWSAGFLDLVKDYNPTTGIANVDDDSVSRLSHKYTAGLVFIFLVLVAGKQYVGQPIECWTPKHFSGDWQAYTENFCWIKNTYWVPHEDNLPDDTADRRKSELGYYQWIPFMLCGVLFCFNLPHMLWKLFSNNSGVHVQTIVNQACDMGNIDPDKRSSTVKTLGRYIEDAILMNDKKISLSEKLRQIFCFVCGHKRLGNYLTSLYLLVKFLYVVNIIAQFLIMNRFLGTNYKFYGLQMLHDLNQDHEWTESGHFPRVTMCDFSIRSLGQKAQNYTVQCVLMINLFNEKIFIFLWFWYLIVAVASILSFFYWLYNCLSQARRVAFIKRFLKLGKVYNHEHEDIIREFVTNRLKVDGIFLLQLIDSNAGGIVTTELVTSMWNSYAEKNNKLKPAVDPTTESITDV